MARRADPERIHDARREARRSRLRMAGELPERVDAWLAAWEAQADAEGRPRDRAYWEAFDAWLETQETGVDCHAGDRGGARQPATGRGV